MITVQETIRRYKNTNLYNELTKIVMKYKAQYFKNNVYIYQSRGLGGIVRNDVIYMWPCDKTDRNLQNLPYIRVRESELRRLDPRKAHVTINIQVCDLTQDNVVYFGRCFVIFKYNQFNEALKQETQNDRNERRHRNFAL